MKYKIGYVDEDESDIGHFYQNFIKKFAGRYQLKDFIPAESIEELVEDILQENLDAVVIDFQLNEYEDVNYRGHTVVEMIKERKKGLPCVLLTSDPVDAIEHSQDTYIVYHKDIAFGDDVEAKALFELQIRQSIEHYRKSLALAEEEFSELLKLDDLSLEQEDTMIKLDDLLESSLNDKHKLPTHLKDRTHVENIESLVTDTKAILEQLRDMNNK